MIPRPAAVGVALALLLGAGCVHRQLTIRSEPPGAELIVNDKPLGITPYRDDFMWYGWYRVTLRQPGYEQLDERVLLKAPWYMWIPFDLVAELLPWTVRDHKDLSYTLAPAVPLPEPSPPALDVPTEEAPPSE